MGHFTIIHFVCKYMLRMDFFYCYGSYFEGYNVMLQEFCFRRVVKFE